MTLDAERWLKFLLRLTGAMMALAFFTVFMPRSWMAACHQWLGLRAFPEGPLVEYLARATSGFYAVAGVALIVGAGDVRRYAPIITVLSVGFLAMAPVILLFLSRSGTPMIWYVLLDAATAVPCFAAVLILQARVRRQDREPAP